MLEYIKIDKKNAGRVILKQKIPGYFFLPLLKHLYHSVKWGLPAQETSDYFTQVLILKFNFSCIFVQKSEDSCKNTQVF